MGKKEHDKYHHQKRREERRSKKDIRPNGNIQPLCRILLNRPTSQWNPGKKQEFDERKLLKIDEEQINDN